LAHRPGVRLDGAKVATLGIWSQMTQRMVRLVPNEGLVRETDATDASFHFHNCRKRRPIVLLTIKESAVSQDSMYDIRY
jgi:hypothetical protein